MKSLRICLVTTFYPPESFGGDGVFVKRLAHALARDGHRVDVLHDSDAFELLSPRSPDGTPEIVPNLTVRSLRRGTFAGAGLLASHQLGRPVGKAVEIREALSSNGYDVIHFHNVSLLGAPGLLRYGAAVKICTLHDYWFVCPMHVLWRYDRERCTRRTCLSCTIAGRRPPQLWRYTGAVGRAVKAVDAFVAPSETCRDLHARNGFLAPIRLLPHFVPDFGGAAEPPSPLTGPEPGAEAPSRPFFLYAGRLERLKGIEALVESFRSYEGADLVIAGAGSLEEKLRGATGSLPHVRMLGRVGDAELRRLYREAVAAIVPSLAYETFGLSAVEAFAAGTPAVVTAGGALEEVVRSSGGGMVYRSHGELLECLAALQSQPDVRQRLAGDARRSYRERFTEAAHLEAYYRLIGELQREARRRPA
ncbi:MAG: glycosyltransferase family 4 protein [Acidobacteriota bacterium]